MGQKVDFNKKEKKSNKLRNIGIFLLIFCTVIILTKSVKDVINSMNKVPETQEQSGLSSNPESSFGTLDDLFESYGCKFISSQQVGDFFNINVDFKYGLYTGEKSNETFFMNISKDVALFENYKNFKLIDSNKDIEIEITCEETAIIEFKINGDVNYYLNNNSRLNRSKTYNITNFTIQSKELQQLLDNDWDENKVDWGTKESNFRGYNVYFDEGIKYTTVSRKVYNVVFTNKYSGNVAGGLSPLANPSQVRSALGTPEFQNAENLYGYVGEKNYLFFDFMNNQISVYPVVSVSEEEESTLKSFIENMNESSDVKTFASKLTGFWTDYDLYDFSANYVDLKYTLRGVELYISSSSLKNGIYIYQNYSGNREIADLENVYIMEDDSVYKSENNRMTNESMKYYGASQQENNDSESYYVELISDHNYDIIKVRFIAKNSDLPDVELNENIYTYVWMSPTELIYSLQNKGIYYYNFNTLTKQVLIEGTEDYHINSYENDILSYDNVSTKIEK